MNKKLLPFIFILIIVIVLELYIQVFDIPSYILPSPSNIIITSLELIPLISEDMLLTTLTSLLGFILALLFSIVISILMIRFKLVEDTLMPIFIAMQSIPSMLLAPIFIVLFGFGLLPKVLLVFLICFFPILISLNQGIKNIDKDYVKLLKIYDASFLEIYYHVYFQGTLKSLFGGMKVALSYSFIGSVFGEMMGGNYGVGLVILKYQSSYQISKVYSIIFIIMIVSLLSYQLIQLLERKYCNYEN